MKHILKNMDEEPAPKNECESPSKKEGKKKSRPKSTKSAKGRESRQSQEKEGTGLSPKKQPKEKSQENRLKRENSKNRRRQGKGEGADDPKQQDKKSNSAKTKTKKIISYSREELLKLRDCDLAQKWPVSLDQKYARGYRKLWKPLACFDDRESEPDESLIERVEVPKRYNERRYGSGRVVSCNSESDYVNLYEDTDVVSRIRTPEKAPEWFTNAPTSQNDVIELKGFDEDEMNEENEKPISPMQDDSAISSILKPGNQPPKQPICNGYFPSNVESMSQALKSALGMKNGNREVLDQHFDANMLNMDMSHLMENENMSSRAHQWFAPENGENEQYVDLNGERTPIGQTFPTGIPDRDSDDIRQWMSQAASENPGMDFPTFEKLVLSNNTKTPTAAAGQEIMMEVLKQQHANQLIRMIQQQRQKQVMSVGALGIKSPLAAMQFPCQSPALTLLKQQSSSPRAPSPIMFGNQPPMHLNAPIPIRPQPQTPNPDYLAYQTQAIMQNALLKRQMEGQRNLLNKHKVEEKKPHRVPFVPTAVMKNLNISTNKDTDGVSNTVSPPQTLEITPERTEDRGATAVGGNLLSPASSSSSSGENHQEKQFKRELEEQEMMREYQMRQRQMRLIDEQLRIYGENSKVGRDVIAIEVQRMQLNEHLNSTTGSPLGRPVLGSGSSISKVQNEQENNNFADLSMFFEPNALQQALTKMPPIPAHNVVSVNELERH